MGFDLHAEGTNDPPAVRNWRIHWVATVASFSALAMGYDTSVIGGTLALNSFRRRFDTDNVSASTRDTLQGNIVSTFQVGCFFGSLLMFPLAERIGRKWSTIFSSIIFLIGGAIMTGAQGNINMIIGGRAIAGLGIGAVSLIVPVYIAETSPPSIRGRLIGIFEVASQGGGMLGFWIAYACDQTIPDASDTQWIVPLGIQLIPGVLLFLGMFACPESPRWLAKKDRWDEAEKTLVWLRTLPADDTYIQAEMAQIRQQVEDLCEHKLSKKEMASRLIQRGTRNRLAMGIGLMCAQNMTGVNIITYYSPRIFETLGITGTDTKLFATGFYGVAKTLGMILFSVWLVERVGRRNGMIGGAFVASIPMFYIGGYVLRANPTAAAAQGDINRDGWGYLAMVCVYLYGFIYCATIQGLTWVICSEIFPLDIRMMCVALTTASQWFWSFLVSRTTPYMITSLGYGTYFFFASLCIVIGVWSFFCVPETKGVTLEEMDAIFAQSVYRAVWCRVRGRPVFAQRDIFTGMPDGMQKEKELELEVTQVERSASR